METSNATPEVPAADRMRPQLGSEPAIAVFTRGELAIARAICVAAASSAAPRTWMVIFFRAPSPSRAIISARSCRTQLSTSSKTSCSLATQLDAAGAVGQNEQRVVGGHVAVDAEPVEAPSGREDQRLAQPGRRDVGVGHDEAQHRRHVRVDHASALGHPRDPHHAVVERKFPEGHLGDPIGGHDGVARRRGRAT